MTGHLHPSIRILFVLSGPDAEHLAGLARILGQQLDARSYRMDAVVGLGEGENRYDAHTQNIFDIPGIEMDLLALGLPLDQSIAYIAHKLPAYDALVMGEYTGNMKLAMERLQWLPPIISYKDVTAGHGGSDSAIVLRWKALLCCAMDGSGSAPPPSIFNSFVQGGFECSTHRRHDKRRLDLLAATLHDTNTRADYLQLHEHGIATVRDGVRWHLIETTDGQYDWSSFLPMLRTARGTGTQVIWDLMHYGWPDHIDIWSPRFVHHFARFAANVARLVKSETDTMPFYCPINEISFLAWGGGDEAYFNPFAQGRSFELKAQLARAAIAAMVEILHIEPLARFVHCEPVIHIVADAGRRDERLEAERARQAQFQAFDMISGALWPQLGGDPRLLDIVGVNYYPHNQWSLGGPPIDVIDRQYRPFRSLISEVYSRYGRPVLVAETGAEGEERAAWFAYVMQEVAEARRKGIPVEGVCLYPIIDHVGWDDDRNCPSGLLANRFENDRRAAYAPLAHMIKRFFESGFDKTRLRYHDC